MDYKKLYAEKLVSAEKAASVVKSGDWVDYGWTTGTPVAVDAAIAKRLPELENVNFRGGILMWVPEIFKIENQAGCSCIPGRSDGRARLFQLRTKCFPSWSYV